MMNAIRIYTSEGSAEKENWRAELRACFRAEKERERMTRTIVAGYLMTIVITAVFVMMIMAGGAV